MKKIILSLALTATSAALSLMSCEKDNSKSTMVLVKLTDNPIDAEEVNVDIEEVRVNFNSDTINGWQTLETNAAVYNLLGLQNGVDSLIATGVIPSDEVKEIRLVLGSDNSIKVNGAVYPLTVPSGSESGLKLKINRKLHGTIDSLLIDFDAALSVHETGAGVYELRPVLQIKE